MNKNILATADAYLRAWNEKDLARIAKHLHPDVTFQGPMNQITGREAFLESTKRIFRLLQGLKVRSKFSAGHEVTAAYDFICLETYRIVPYRSLISQIELFR